MKFRKLIAAFSLAPLGLAAIPAQAAWTAATNAWVGNPSVFAGGVADIDSRYSYNGTAAQLTGTGYFWGLNGVGEESVMSFEYSSMAQATSTSLKARASGSLTGGFYNSANPAYMRGFIGWSPDIDYSGVPSSFESSGTAFYQQRLAVTGGPDLAYIKVDVKVDGNSSITLSDYASTWAYLDFRGAGIYTLNDATVDQTFRSDQISVSGGFADVQIMLGTAVRFNVDGATEFSGSLLTGSVDFSHTATIGTLYGFDAHGRPVDLISASTGSGQTFTTFRVDPPPPVPEPGTIVLMVGGLAVLAVKSRRAKRTG